MNRYIKFEILLKALQDTKSGHKKGDEVKMVNEIFDRKNGVAFWEIGLDWEILYQRQYTGLKDTNGNEIYEGDIIQFKYDDAAEELGYNWITGIVSFIGGCFRCSELGFDYDLKKELPMTLLEWLDDSCTIIGNIYENPDLLNS